MPISKMFFFCHYQCFLMKIFSNYDFMALKHKKIIIDDQSVLANVTFFPNFGGFLILISLSFFT